MPPERLSEHTTGESATEPSLPSSPAVRNAKARRNSAVNRLDLEDRLLFGIAWRERGWGARIRTWDHETKTRCLTAWPRPITLCWKPLLKPSSLPAQPAARSGGPDRRPNSIRPVRQWIGRFPPKKLCAGAPYSMLRAHPAPSIYGPSSSHFGRGGV